MRLTEGNVLSQCLKCLSQLFVYINGVEYLKQRPHLFIRLWEMVHYNNIEVRKQLLGIFIGLCKIMHGAYERINKASIINARSNNRSPFAILLNSLNQNNDVELKVNVLTLINWMMFKCPSEKKLCKFIARLENIGIYDELRLLAKEKNPEIINQLKNFQKNSKLIIPSL